MASNDKYGYHEVLHLSSVLVTLWEDEILEHGAVQDSPELKEAASAILNKLAEFYQLAGQVGDKKFPWTDK